MNQGTQLLTSEDSGDKPVAWFGRDIIRCGLAIVLTGLFAGCMASGDTPEDELEQGRLLCDRNQHSDAIPHLSRAIEGLANKTDAYYLRGVAQERTDQLAAARDDYLACLENNPDHLPARNNLAVVFARLKKPDEAIRHLDLAIRAEPKNVLAIRNRALCRHDLGLYAEALDDYDLAIGLADDDPATWFQRGNLRLDMGEYAAAIADFDRCISLDDQFAPAFMNRGVAKYGTGDEDAGDRDVERARQLSPQLPIPKMPQFETAPAAAEALALAAKPRANGWNEDRLTAAIQFLESAGLDVAEASAPLSISPEAPNWTLLTVGGQGGEFRILLGLAHSDDLADEALADKDAIPELSPQLVEKLCAFDGQQGLLIFRLDLGWEIPIRWEADWKPTTADFVPAGFRLQFPGNADSPQNSVQDVP